MQLSTAPLLLSAIFFDRLRRNFHDERIGIPLSIWIDCLQTPPGQRSNRFLSRITQCLSQHDLECECCAGVARDLMRRQFSPIRSATSCRQITPSLSSVTVSATIAARGIRRGSRLILEPLGTVVEVEGFEPTTPRLQSGCSPPELHPRSCAVQVIRQWGSGQAPRASSLEGHGVRLGFFLVLDADLDDGVALAKLDGFKDLGSHLVL